MRQIGLKPDHDLTTNRKGEKMKTQKLTIKEKRCSTCNEPFFGLKPVCDCKTPKSNIRTAFNALRDELRQRVLERDEVITGAFIALLAKLNVFLLGKPGTAKSYLTKLICLSMTVTSYF